MSKTPLKHKTSSMRAAMMAAVLVLVFSDASAAQTPANEPATQSDALSVSPPTSEFAGTPGSSISQSIGLDNVSDNPRNISVEVQNFLPSDQEEGQARLTTEDNRYALSQWVTVTPKSATLEAHGHQDFKVDIKVPANAPPGGHFGAVIFSPGVNNSTDGAALSVVQQVTSLILLKVPGDVTEKASVAGVNVCKLAAKITTCDKSSSFLQKGPTTFTARIKSDSNVQIRPKGTLTIYNIFGQKVKTINFEERNVLPASVRRFDTTWDKKSPFGIYKAKIDMTYGDNNQTLHAEKSFTILPVATIVIAVIALIVLFLILWLPRKRLKAAFRALSSPDSTTKSE